jgi:hypothetical protein
VPVGQGLAGGHSDIHRLDISDDGVGGERKFPEKLLADDPGANDVCSDLPFFLQDDNMEALVGQEFCGIEAAGTGADHGHIINAHRLLSLPKFFLLYSYSRQIQGA